MFIRSRLSEIAVSLVLRRHVEIRPNPYCRLPSQSFPSIAFRSEASCFSICFCTGFTFSFLGGLPSFGPLNRIPSSLQYARFSRVR